MLEVRALSPDDWKTTREIRLAALLDAPQAFGGSYEETASRDEQAWREWPSNGQAYGAWLDGEPIGMAAWVQKSEDPEVGSLIAMWVSPAARGSGAAGELIDAVARHARGADNQVLELVVYKTNPAAQRAYRKYGFVDLGESERWPNGLVMRFDLS
jgi:ribosomal protein S18 acetylase RimI-like enzyme